MRTLIVEDEPIAAERLAVILQQVRPVAKLVGTTETVSETLEWLKWNPEPDLLLMDIQLSDGHCFEIFRRQSMQCPVIFTTAFDHYAMDAFKVTSIDYLLKPVSAPALKKALDKLDCLRGGALASAWSQVSAQAGDSPKQSFKTRFLARIGTRTYFIDAADVAYFAASNKIVYLNAHDGTRYMIDYTLESLEQLLDPSRFFRLNRSIIVQASAVQHIKPYINSRLKLTVKAGANEEEVIVSRDRVQTFRQWADS